MSKIPSKDELIHLLNTDDRWLGRALVALNRKQTEDERRVEATRYTNNEGFSSSHARLGTSMANYFTRHGKLTPKQAAYWRKMLPSGRTRIGMYASQLIKIAKEQAAENARKAAMSDEELMREFGRTAAQR